jgi:hypothetical protein
MPHLEDATFLHDENPDPERYDEVTDATEPVAEPAPEAAAPQPEEA